MLDVSFKSKDSNYLKDTIVINNIYDSTLIRHDEGLKQYVPYIEKKIKNNLKI